jgi:hypothetical protein
MKELAKINRLTIPLPGNGPSYIVIRFVKEELMEDGLCKP